MLRIRMFDARSIHGRVEGAEEAKGKGDYACEDQRGSKGGVDGIIADLDPVSSVPLSSSTCRTSCMHTWLANGFDISDRN